jgi:hypothetical protein
MGEQHEPGRRRVQRQPTGHARHVDDRAGRGKPLDEQHVAVLQDSQLRVVPDDGVEVFHERQRRLAQPERRRCARSQLPQPDAHADPPIGVASQPAVPDQLLDQPRSRRDVQPGPPRDVGDAQRGRVRFERLEDPDDARQHGVAFHHVRQCAPPERGTLPGVTAAR